MQKKLPYRRFSLREKQEWINNILKIYEGMEKKSKKGSYNIQINDLDIRVSQKVYAPQFFSDSLWFSKELPIIVGKKSLLEIGTGTGIIGLSCALKGANVVATDISSYAVKNARENFRKYRINARIIKSDIYNDIPRKEKFDFIFWSHPYNNSNEPVEEILLCSGFDYKYNGLSKYIREAKSHLTSRGKLLLGTGNTADQEEIKKIADREGYSIKVLKKLEMPLGDKDKYKIVNMIIQFVPK